MKFSTFLLGAASAAVLSSAASAADLPGRVVKPGVAPAAAGCFWQGPYVGAQAGYTWGRFDNNINVPTAAPLGFAFVPAAGVAAIGDAKHSKFTGGLYAGYNFCVTPSLIVGLEADVMKYGHSGKYSTIVGGTGYAAEFDANWGGSLRARIGLPFDRFLVYATGGIAGAQISGATYTRAGGVTTLVGSGSKFVLGYTVGAGLEYAFTQNLVGRVEYNYTDLGNVGIGGLGRVNADFHTIRLGVAYKF